MKMYYRSIKVFLAVLIIAVGAATIVLAEGKQEQPDYLTIPGKHGDTWKLEATNPLLIGGYGDNFVYDGKRAVALEGTATVDVNARTNTGLMEVNFKGTINPEMDKTYTGDIRIV